MSDYKFTLKIFLIIWIAWFFLPIILLYISGSILMGILGFMIGTLWLQYLGRGGIAKSDAN